MKRRMLILTMVIGLVASTVWLGTASADIGLLSGSAEVVDDATDALSGAADNSGTADNSGDGGSDLLDGLLDPEAEGDASAEASAEATVPLPPEPAARVTVEADGKKVVVNKDGKKDQELTFEALAETGAELFLGQDPDCPLAVNTVAHVQTDDSTVHLRIARSYTPTSPDGSTGARQHDVLFDEIVDVEEHSATVTVCAG